MNYPFQFDTILITSKLLDVMGFSEYWPGCGEFGERALDLGGKTGDIRLKSKGEFPLYYIKEIDETEDPESGYGYGKPQYCSNHFCNKDFQPMYFIHEMYEDIISRRTPKEIENFISLCGKKGVNLYPYIQSYLTYKQTWKD